MLSLIESMHEALEARQMVDGLFAKCEDISTKMQKKVESLIKNGESSKSDQNDLEIKYQPSNLNKA